MKLELERDDIEAIARRVADLLRSHLKQPVTEQEKIFTVKTLAEYLEVTEAWIYKYVSQRGIPYFKSGKYTRFKKTEIDEWIKENGQPVYNTPDWRKP